ncbi:alpha-ketoglutarate-dependent dioxygenase AlkB [uncultured Shewanella sp.]|uniref:alpha-ketoglutarate-dependent dioxygenase AlkB family protein n=1 Tax=uncultured Shewanella sp. TaxID=173975 RepID=UPI00262DA8C5|nr:alpha-ketoglutarate-dependent dioxygenase AlkB [uncultured Shewanella sp.]
MDTVETNKIGVLQPPITSVKNYLNAEQVQVLIDEAQYYPFEKPIITVYGKQYPIPRQQVWFANEGCDYRFSSLFIKAKPWPKYAHKLQKKLQRDFDIKSNGVLVNRYANGDDSMGWHSDDEPEIKAYSDIISVSVGACRDFIMRHKGTQSQYKVRLNSGDLLIMHWPMQKDWEHALPKRKRVKDLRLNFTFRCLIPYFH